MFVNLLKIWPEMLFISFEIWLVYFEISNKQNQNDAMLKSVTDHLKFSHTTKIEKCNIRTKSETNLTIF